MSLKQYKITVTSFTSQTPCDGFYVHTGLTQNIAQSSPINGTPSLINVTSGYTFNLEISDTYDFVFIFIIHCDGYDTNQNLQGGYQVSIADLRCTDCFKGNCSFDVVVEILSTPLPPASPTITPTNTSTPTNTPTPTITSTNTITPTNTPTLTNTTTPTNTPTNTPTFTPTNTPTITPTPTEPFVMSFRYELNGDETGGEIDSDGTVIIKWGDGNEDTYVGVNQSFHHTYVSGGTYEVEFFVSPTTSLNEIGIYSGDTISFDITDLPSTLLSLDVGFFVPNTVTGNLSDLPPNIQSLSVRGSNTITGDLSDLPNTVIYLEIYGSNTITGDLSSLVGLSLSHFAISGSNTITGDISNIPSTINSYIVIYGNNTVYGDLINILGNPTYLSITGSNTITGDVQNIPTSVVGLDLVGNNTVYGNIENIPTSITSAQFQGFNTIAGDIALTSSSLKSLILAGGSTSIYTTKSWPSNMFNLYIRTSLSTSEVDQLLVDLSQTTWTGDKIIDLQGNNDPRSSASDTAVATLIGLGVTVLTN